MPHNPKDAGTGSNCCFGPAPPGGGRRRCAHDHLRSPRVGLLCRVRGFYPPGSRQAAKGLMVGITPDLYAAHKQETA
jgi:hypothetical protein